MSYLIAYDPQNSSGLNPYRRRGRRPRGGWRVPLYVQRVNSSRLHSFIYYGAALRLCNQLNERSPGSHFVVEE